MFRLTNLATAIASLLICAALWAQTNPATSLSLPPGAIKVTVVAVQGIVQYRTSSDQKWQKAEQDVELSEGAELRTGPRSAVQFKIGDDQTVTLDRLGTIKILRADFESGKVFTDLGMKYGRTRYDIESAAREHDAKVRSPSSVLAVRGTKFIAQDEAPFAPSAVSLDGRVMFRDAKKLVAFGNKGQGKTKIDTQSDSAAKTALKTTTILPTGKFTGASNADANRLVATNYAGYENMGVFSLLAQARLQNFPLIASIPVSEELDFGVSGFGTPKLSNFDVQVIAPNGTITDKNHPRNTTPTFSTYNDPGPADSFGQVQKNVTYAIAFLPGTYTVTTTLTAGGPIGEPSNPALGNGVNVNVSRDPTSEANDPAFYTTPDFTLDSKHPSKTIKINVAPGKPITDVTPAIASAKRVKAPKPPVKIVTRSRPRH